MLFSEIYIVSSGRIVVFILLVFFISLNSSAEYIYYKVKKGDTFFSLSRKFNVDVWMIQKENSITTLREGEIIKLPLRNQITYTVQKGDTLFSLSKKFGTTIEEIISANKLQSIDIKNGQTLIIPSKNVPQKSSLEIKPQNKDNIYVIEKGDTLYSISRKTGVPLNKLTTINKINPNSFLKPGMILVLPSSNKPSKKLSNNDSIQISKINLSLPISNTKFVKNHSSRFLEIISYNENRVKAIMDGEIIFVGSFSIFGKTIIIKHSENVYTIYGMINEENVKVGDKIKKGQTIGITLKDPKSGYYITKFSFIINDKMFVPGKI